MKRDFCWYLEDRTTWRAEFWHVDSHGPWYAESVGLGQSRARSARTEREVFTSANISAPLTTYRAVLWYLDRFKYRVGYIWNVKRNTARKAWKSSAKREQSVFLFLGTQSTNLAFQWVTLRITEPACSFNSFKIINFEFAISLYDSYWYKIQQHLFFFLNILKMIEFGI